MRRTIGCGLEREGKGPAELAFVIPTNPSALTLMAKLYLIIATERAWVSVDELPSLKRFIIVSFIRIPPD